jgi:hypothetical protein
LFSSPSSKVIKTVGRKTFFAWDEDTVTSILHAQEIDDDGEEDIRVVSLCPFAALSVVVVVSKLESLEVERVQIPLDTIYYEWERAGVVTASEQSLVVMVSRVRVQLLVKV